MIHIVPKSHEQQLSRDFNTSELKCNCMNMECDFTIFSTELISRLQYLRDRLGPMVVTSGFRCSRHNKASGGRPLSQHLAGLAADIAIPKDVGLNELKDAIAAAGFGFSYINSERGFFHVDVRGKE